ncbi:MAG: response regulator [Lysobacter sp.]|nr:response regulator [Lysobacter sp.]
MIAAAYDWLHSRLARRPDSEHGQAMVRLGVMFVVLVYLLIRHALHVEADQNATAVLLMVAVGFVVGSAILVGILLQPGVSHVRRAIGMASDYGLMGAAMVQMGEPLAWVYVILMWVTVGNGLRYGTHYLHAAVAMAVLSFGAVVFSNEYWQGNRSLGIGLLVGLVAVPMYLSGLLRALTRATSEARRANEAKSRFLANMSHEFRTPLNGLSGTSELLATPRLDSEQREYINTIQASTRSLLSLVEDVLDISAIEAGKLKLSEENFALQELIDHIGMILLPAARAKQLYYEVEVGSDVPSQLRGDPAHLRQVLLNLVSNAIKFTDKGFVRLNVAMAERQEAEVMRLRFTISDSGIGIASSARAKLFEAFEQADASLSRRHAGTGLGTTIAKGLTEAMGGSIGFESVENAGSKFWVELPFRLIEMPQRQLAVADVSPTAPVMEDLQQENVIAFSDPFLRHRVRVRAMQVLIADDYAANRMVLQRLLQKAGHRVVAVEDGEEALSALEASDYDVVIVDLHMPGISGLDLLRQLRVMEAGSSRRTPVIVLTADVTPDAIQRCEQAGARAFIAKPVVASRLLDTLAEVALTGHASAPMQTGSKDLPISDDVFDPNVLDELIGVGVGKAFESEFIGQCLSDAKTCLALFEKYGQEERWGQIREQLHALKGVASNLGLRRLGAVSDEVMRLADWQIAREWRVRLSGLRERLAQGSAVLSARGQPSHVRDGDTDGSK